MANTFRVDGQIFVLYYKERDTFIAYAPALDLSSCGSTFEEADKNFEEARHILFSECDERGTLQDVLAACGWESRSEKGTRVWRPPAVVGKKEMQISVPA